MTRSIVLNKNGMLMQRLGNLSFGKQDRWSRAPENKGMWAFPYPYYESFFTYHQYLDRIPKRLQDNPRLGVPYGTEFAYISPNYKHIPITSDQVEMAESWTFRGPLGEVEAINSEELYDEQTRWVEKVGRKIVPIKKFYWTGEVYTHFTRSGEVLPLDEWTVMNIEQLRRVIIKTRGDRAYYEDNAEPQRITPTAIPYRYSHDHFEVFMTQKMGKIHGMFVKN